ncbi:MAG: T9SS type A sorting domain-containing protein, partial [Gemmatimonadetes bacterium]|nr:T9SS type A sorting domain-containing protein [Gemmatimonadota bacterium]
IDFRNIHDTYMQNKGITYFENSRRATLAQRAYCIDNPGNQIGYSDSLWGLTAGDGPFGYSARGAPPAQNDDGTITPTAAISSIPFAPEVCIPAARNMYNLLKAQLWGEYGFRDGFNLNYAWFASDVLGIDQGPMILGIENYLNNSIWDRFMQNADIIAGLQVAGFSVITDVADGPGPNLDDYQLLTSTPNPFGRSTSIRFRIPSADHVTLAVYDVRGREVARLVDGFMPAGAHEATLSAAGLASGVYYYRLETGDRTLTKRTVLLK